MKTAFILWFALLSTPALANDPAPHPAPAGHDAPAAHGEKAGEHGAAGAHDAKAGEHGAEGGHDEKHGKGHHAVYPGDTDGDGLPNWLDPQNGPGPFTLADIYWNRANPDFVVHKLAFHVFNFIMLIALMAWAGGGAVKSFFKERSTSVRAELIETARQRDEALQQFQELQGRLQRFEQELVDMKAEAERAAKAEELRLIDRAEKEAARLGESARRNIADEAARARADLRKEAIELAVDLAGSLLQKQVQAGDQQALARQFLDALNASSSTPSTGSSHV